MPLFADIDNVVTCVEHKAAATQEAFPPQSKPPKIGFSRPSAPTRSTRSTRSRLKDCCVQSEGGRSAFQ